MSKTRMTISVESDIATYLRSAPNVSFVVSEAITQYRAKELERRLEAAYRENAEESERLNHEWESADSEIDE
jgi:hypothetical protein